LIDPLAGPLRGPPPPLRVNLWVREGGGTRRRGDQVGLYIN